MMGLCNAIAVALSPNLPCFWLCKGWSGHTQGWTVADRQTLICIQRLPYSRCQGSWVPAKAVRGTSEHSQEHLLMDLEKSPSPRERRHRRDLSELKPSVMLEGQAQSRACVTSCLHCRAQSEGGYFIGSSVLWSGVSCCWHLFSQRPVLAGASAGTGWTNLISHIQDAWPSL